MRGTQAVCSILLTISVWQLGGCAPPTFPVMVPFGEGAIASFTLEGGVAAQKSSPFTDFPTPVTIGSGTFTIDPSAISVTSLANGSGKRILFREQQISCSAQVEADGVAAACLADGSTEEACSEQVRQAILTCLGNLMTLQVTAWVGDVEATVFDDGDRYGVYTVTINAEGQGVSVSPSAITLTQRTTDLLNSGNFALGLELIFGEDATVAIESVTLNLGL